MKNVIIYKSNTGFTKEYAEMLARRIVPSEVYDIKKLNRKILKDADNIFFGGPLRNNEILGLNKFLKFYDLISEKNVFIFATGIEPINDEKKESVIFVNGLDNYHVRLYLLPGGLDFKRFSKFKQKFFRMGIIAAGKKQGLSEEVIKQRLDTAINMVNSSNLDRMVEVYRKINIEVK